MLKLIKVTINLMPQVYNKDVLETVIRKIAGNIARHNRDSFTTAIGNDRIPDVEGVLPDIQLIDKATGMVTLGIVVESLSSLSTDRASTVWKPVSLKCGLELAVPKGQTNRARNLCRKLDIKAKIIEY